MNNYAISRIKKHQRIAAASYLINHHLRLVSVANADEAKSSKNKVLMQKDDIKKFLKEVPEGSRANAVRLVDVLFTASRFEGKSHLKNWVDATMTFAKKEFGEDNIALAVIHLDETTPHIHLIFKPVNPKTKKLSAGFWFDGRAKMQSYQDRYHAAVGDLGFARGERNSRAKHQTIKQFYSKMPNIEKTYAAYEKSLEKLHEANAQLTLWERLKPERMMARLTPFIQDVQQKSKKIIGMKELLRVKEVAKKNVDLTDLIEFQAEQLEQLTGSKKPDFKQMELVTNLFQAFKTENHKKEAEKNERLAQLEKDQAQKPAALPNQQRFAKPSPRR